MNCSSTEVLGGIKMKKMFNIIYLIFLIILLISDIYLLFSQGIKIFNIIIIFGLVPAIVITITDIRR